MAQNIEINALLQSRFDESGFRDLDARLDRASSRLEAFGRLEASPSISLDTTDLDTRLERSETRLDGFDGRVATAEARLDTALFDTRMDGAEGRLDKFDGRVAKAEAHLDTTRLDAGVVAAEARLERLDGRVAHMEARLDTRDAETRFGAFEGFVKSIAGRISALRPSVSVTGDTRDAESRFSFFETFVGGIASRISSLRPTLTARGDTRDAEGRFSGLESFVRGIAERISSLRPTINVDSDTGAATGKITALWAFIRAIPNRRVNVDVDVDTHGAEARMLGVGTGLNNLGRNANETRNAFGEFNDKLRLSQEILGLFWETAHFHLIATGLAAIAPLATSAGAGLVALASALVTAGAGLAGFGAIAYAGVGGLSAYASIVKEVAKASLDGSLAFGRHAQASAEFNAALGNLRAGFRELVLDVGGQALPTMTAFVNQGTQMLPLVGRAMDRLVTSVGQAGAAFLQALNTGTQMRNIEVVLNAAAKAAGQLATIGGNLALIFVNIFAAANMDGNRLLSLLVGLTDRMREVSRSTEFMGKVEEFMQRASDAAIALAKGIGNVVVAFFQIGQAINQSGLTTTLTSGLLHATESFRELTKEGGRGEAQILQMGHAAKPILQDIGNLVIVAAREFLTLGRNLALAGREAGGLSLLQQTIRAITSALPVLREGLETTFTNIAPAVARLVPALAAFLNTMASATPVMAAFINHFAAFLEAFEKLPGPVKTSISMLAEFAFVGAAANKMIGLILSPLGALARLFITVGPAAEGARLAISGMTLVGGPATRAVVGLGTSFTALAGILGISSLALGGIIVALGAAVAGLIYLSQHTTGARDSLARLAQSFGLTERESKDFRKSLDEHRGAAQLFATGLNHARDGLASLGRRFGQSQAESDRFRAALQNHRGASELFSQAMNHIGAALAPLGQRLSGAVQAVRDFANRAGEALRDLPGRVGRYLGEIPARAVAAFNQLRAQATPALSSFGASVQRFFADLPRNAGRALGSLAGIVAGHLANLARSAGPPLGQFTLTVITFFNQLPTRVGNAVIRFVQRVAEDLGQLRALAHQKVADFGNDVISFFQTLPGRVIPAVTGFVNQVVQGYLELRSRAMQGVTDFGNTVISFFQALPGRAAGAIADFVSQAAAGFQALNSGARQAVVNFGDGVISFFQTLPGRAASAVANFVSQVVQGYQDMSTRGNQIVTNFGDEVIAYFQALPGRVLGPIAAFGQGVIDGFRDMYMQVVGNSIVPEMMDAIVASFASLPGRVMGLVDELVSGIISAFTSLASQAASILSGLADSAVSAFKRAKSAILDNSPVPDLVQGVARHFADMRDDTVQKSGAIENALVNSFKRGADKAQESVKGLVNAAKNLPVPGDMPSDGIAGVPGPAPGQNQDPLKPLADNSERQLDRLTKRTEDAGKTIQEALTKTLTSASTISLKALEDLDKTGNRSLDNFATGGSRSLDLLSKNGIRSSDELRDTTIAQVMDMANKSTQALAQYQVMGTNQLTTLQRNGTNESQVLQRNSTASVDVMRNENVRAITDMEVRGTDLFRSLQRNGTTESKTLETNSVAAMRSAETGIVNALTSANTQGVSQMESLRSGGSRAMTAADPEWRGPVGKAAAGVQAYLNDMLYGMAQVIDAAKLTIEKPAQFTPRLSGAARGGILGKSGLRRFAAGGATEYDATQLTRGQVDNALHSGAYNDPTDHKEAIYVPAGKTMAEDGSLVGSGFYGGGSGGSSFSASVPLSFSMTGFASGGEGDDADWGALMAFLRQGQLEWDEGKGGVSKPGMSQLHWWGEGDGSNATEYYIVHGREENLPVLQAAADSLGQVVVPRTQHGGDFGGGEMGRAGLDALRGFATGGLSNDAIALLTSRAEEAMGAPYIYGPMGTHSGLDGYTCSGLWSHILYGDTGDPSYGTYAYAAGMPGLVPGPGQVEIGVDLGGWGGFDGTHMAGDIMGTTYESNVPSGVHHGYGAGAFGTIWHTGEDYDAATTGGGGSRPSIQPQIDKYFPKEPTTFGGQGIPDEEAIEIGKLARKALIDSLKKSAGSGSWNGGGNVDEWITQGLLFGGVFSDTPDVHSAFASRIQQESGGNPSAINDWDSNAQAGHPSKGLLQLIDSTWEAHRATHGEDAGPFEGNWDNPIKSVGVGSRYMQDAYGGPVGANGSGYANGGIATKPQVASVAENGPEFFMPLHDPSSARRFVEFLDGALESHGAGRGRGMREAIAENTRAITSLAAAMGQAPPSGMSVNQSDIASGPGNQSIVQSRTNRQIDPGIQIGPIDQRYVQSGAGSHINKYDYSGHVINQPGNGSTSDGGSFPGPDALVRAQDGSYVPSVQGSIQTATAHHGQVALSRQVSLNNQRINNMSDPGHSQVGPDNQSGNFLYLQPGVTHGTITQNGQVVAPSNRDSNANMDKKLDELKQTVERGDKGIQDHLSVTSRDLQGSFRANVDKLNTSLSGDLKNLNLGVSGDLKTLHEGISTLRSHLKENLHNLRDGIRSSIDAMKHDLSGQVKGLQGTSERVGKEQGAHLQKMRDGVREMGEAFKKGDPTTAELLAVTRRVWGLADGGKITSPTPAVLGERAAMGETEYVLSDAPRVRDRTLGLMDELADSLGYTLLDERGRPRNSGPHRLIHGAQDHRHAVPEGAIAANGGPGTLDWDLVQGKVIRYKNNSAYKQDIATAFNRWNEVGGAYLLPHYGNSPNLTISDRPGDGWIGLTGSTGYMYLDPSAMRIGGNVAHTLVGHEAGHAFGIDHMPGTIMNSSVNLGGGNVEYPGGSALGAFMNMWGSGGGKPKVPESFHMGGIVPGIGDRLILAEGGEEVVPKETVRALPEERRERRTDSREIAEAIRDLKKANAADRQALVDEIVALKEEQRVMARRMGREFRSGSIENHRDDPEFGDAVEGRLNDTFRRKDFAGDFDW